MRKIIVFNRVSADGYFAGADGNLDWVVQETGFDSDVAGRLSGSDMMLFGRKTYDMFESFWPHAIDTPTTAMDPHGPPRSTPELHAMGVWINESAKLVFSRTRTEVPWRNSRLAPGLEPREIDALKRGPGKDILVFGSGSVASQLTRHSLVDEYHFVVCPVVLGEGRSLLTGVPASVRLQLAEARPYPSGNVMLRYTRAG
jgi:dihydrofolate reductase